MAGLPVIRVTTEDTETGEKDVKDITDDYVIVCAGRHYVHHIQKHANGTTILTIKVDQS
jgi:hypothetical protein